MTKNEDRVEIVWEIRETFRLEVATSELRAVAGSIDAGELLGSTSGGLDGFLADREHPSNSFGVVDRQVVDVERAA
jgi:hypothetical protein